MARPINPERTGPGICRECSKFANKRLNGWCHPCYDRLRRNNNPFARVAVQQKAKDKAPSDLARLQYYAKKLWENESFTTDEYAIIHEICQDAYDRHRSETAPDLRRQYKEAMMAKLEVESQNMQPQPDQVEVDLQNIPPNPNPVEVEEISNQPQPDSIEPVEDDGGDEGPPSTD
jgi:hypothetical protein